MIGFQAKRIVKLALKGLWLHRLRSGLTVLGITFGVCSVIAMLAIGTGASQEAQQQIEKLGSHNIIIQSVSPPASEDVSSESSRVNQYGLTFTDAERIRDTVAAVEVIVPARKVRRRVIYGSRQLGTNLVGTIPWYLGVVKGTLKQGRFLSTVDMHGRSSVCVLGMRAARTLFPFGDAVGSVIRVDKLRYRVVGVISSTARGEVGGLELQGDPDSDIYVPLTALQSHFGETIVNQSSGSSTIEKVEIHELIVKVENLDSVIRTEKAIRSILEQGHKEEDYQVVVPLQLLEQARHTRRIFNIVLGSIAAISLLVGGIGIMNITLASVMERTREIGIRRAMGAKKRHIVIHFLTETVLLSVAGGALGILLGVLAPYFVTRFAGMATVITAWSLLLAFGISATVGIVFGIYPAYRAANMDPIEALRHE